MLLSIIENRLNLMSRINEINAETLILKNLFLIEMNKQNIINIYNI